MIRHILLIKFKESSPLTEIEKLKGLFEAMPVFLVKRKPLKLKHNKAFKRDSCRVAFLVCSEFWW